ncbi:hypothetical protein QTP86_022469, partial [Hemibagrus guttatus]
DTSLLKVGGMTQHYMLSSERGTTLEAEMACKDENLTLSQYITLTIHIDNLLCSQHPSFQAWPCPILGENTLQNPSSMPGPTQLRKTRVSPVERQRRFRFQLCFYCGHSGHRCSICPEKPRKCASKTSLNSCPLSLMLPVQLYFAKQHLKHCFTSAPILHHPDPSIPFVVEVDASNCGTGQCYPNVMATQDSERDSVGRNRQKDSETDSAGRNRQRDSVRDSVKNRQRDSVRDSVKNRQRDSVRDSVKTRQRDSVRDSVKNRQRDSVRDSFKNR